MATAVRLDRRARRSWTGWLPIAIGLTAATVLPAVQAAKKGGADVKVLKAAKPPKLLSKEQIFTRIAPATVLIVIAQPGGMSVGSGVIVDGGGLIVTNRHVVEAASGTVQVFIYNPKERSLEANLGGYVKSHTPIIGRVVKRGRGEDLALVRLPTLASAYPSIELADSDALRIGQDVVAIGNPHGLTWTFTSGTISAIRKESIQTDASINPGNSGGPLLDMFGRLAGINTFIRKDAQGLGFAIPANTVKAFIDKFGSAQEVDSDVADKPVGLSLSKNPVPLAALSIAQDLGKLRALLGRRVNRQAELLLLRDLDSVEELRQRMIRGEFTVGQTLPAVAEKLQLLAQHNAASDDVGDTKQAFLQQLEHTAEHMKQIVQVAK